MTKILKNRLEFPPIGLRIIKSAVAVFLCFVVDYLRNGSGIVFYSQLSALWCMQDYDAQTIKNAKQRIIGTMVGAFYGLIVLLLFQKTQKSNISIYFLHALIVSVFIIGIIYTTVVFQKKNASYFSCVVFLSIVVNHANDIYPHVFVMNRVLDTMIGIAIGVGVNIFTTSRKKNTDILFISGIDDTLLNEKNNMSGYSRVELNRMLDNGLHFTISTVRTPASLMDAVRDIRLKLPVIVMDGAALYNIAEKKFEKVYVISKDHGKKVADFLQQSGCSYFTNIILEDTVLIYYQNSENEIYNHVVQKLRKSPYRNYIHRQPPEDESVVYYMMIDQDEKIQSLYQSLIECDFAKNLKITLTPSKEHEGCTYLRIYNHNACKQNMIDYLLTMVSVSKVVTFGTLVGQYTHLIAPGDSNKVVKMVKQEFEK